MIDKRKYILTFILTAAIFATAFYISNFFTEKRVETVKSIQDNIAIDILSNETQFDLLGQVSCSNVDNSILSPELDDLASKLSATENQGGQNNEQIIYLKKYYALLEIKDYLLSQKISEKCAAKKPIFIIYFYSNTGDCSDCVKEGYVLTKLKETYPDLRIYSFDYNQPLSAVDSMKKIYRIKPKLPALVLEDKVYYGFKDEATLESLLPDLPKATSTLQTSTSTKK